MKLQNLLYTLMISYLCCSCLVPPATSYRVVVPEETLMRYRKFIPSDERITYKSYQTVITELPDGSFRERTFYPEKYQCTYEITYTDKSFATRNGSYKEWWDDGFKKVEGHYKDGLAEGAWKSYNMKDGELSREVSYIDGKKQDIEKNYEDGIIVSTYEYNMGVKEGSFTTYDSLGVMINEGEYRADTIFKQTKIYEANPNQLTGSEKMPSFPGCENISVEKEGRMCAQRKMLEFIYGSIRYPADARERGIQGTAIIRFVIDRDGSIKNVEPVRGVSQTIEEECLRIVNSMPTWNPGMQNEKPVKVQYNLPIKFKLQ